MGVGFALAVACVLWAAVAAPAATPSSFFGVVAQRALTDQDLERMSAAEVGTLRFEIFWAGVDRTAAAGDLDWSAPDAIVERAARNGIQPLPFLYSTPEWVAALDGRSCGGNCAAFAPKGKAALAAWSDFLSAAAQRYGPSGSFWTENPDVPKLPIRVWQLWNEQNSPSFYKPKPKVRAYAKLLDAGHDAIASVDRGAEIILGGMFGTPRQGRKPAIDAWKYLGALYDVKGAKRNFEGIAPHPYAPKLKTVKLQIELMRKETRRAGDRGVDLWITEIGWGSAGPPNPLNRGPAGQASRLTQAFKYFEKKRNKLNIRNVDWYSWRDNPDAQAGLCVWCPFSGLVTQDLGEKPSLAAFTKFTGGN